MCVSADICVYVCVVQDTLKGRCMIVRVYMCVCQSSCVLASQEDTAVIW